MPLYVYTCDSCKHMFDKQLKISSRKEPESEPCPKCNEMAVKQTIFAPTPISPFRLEGGMKPSPEFKERMKQVKENFRYDGAAKIKDY